MVNACLKTAGMIGSGIVAVASLAVSIAEYVREPEDGNDDTNPSVQPSLAPCSTPSTAPQPTATTASPAAQHTFATYSPTCAPVSGNSSPSHSLPPTPFPASSPMGSDDENPSFWEDFDGIAFGFLLASVVFLVLSICLWRSMKFRPLRVEDEQEEYHQA